MTKAILYDLDGVLMTGKRFSNTYSEEFGVPISDMDPFFDGPFKDCLVGKADLKELLKGGWLKRWRWSGTADELLNYWFACGDNKNDPISKSAKEMRAKGISTGIATNQEKCRAEYLIKKFDFNVHFDWVFASNKLGTQKYKPAFFEHVLKILEKDGVEPGSVLYFDDSESDVKSAKSVGIDAVLFENNDQYFEELNKRL